jgi:hypothetical protein
MLLGLEILDATSGLLGLENQAPRATRLERPAGECWVLAWSRGEEEGGILARVVKAARGA